MNQGDRAWHYSHGSKGAVRRVALVVGLHDSGDMERVNLWVFPTGPDDFQMTPNQMAATPVRYDYKEGGPVDTPFCTPMDLPMILREFSPEVAEALTAAKDGEIVSVSSLRTPNKMPKPRQVAKLPHSR